MILRILKVNVCIVLLLVEWLIVIISIIWILADVYFIFQ